MKRVRDDIMGMPIAVEIVDESRENDLQAVFDYFSEIDAQFSTYKSDSEISRINRGEVSIEEWSDAMRDIFKRADDTRVETGGYFDIRTPEGLLDPSGIVKGWAIQNAARLLAMRGYLNFYIDAGGDIEARGYNAKGARWTVGIRNPLNRNEIVKHVRLTDAGIATSGTYVRGAHIYNPLSPAESPNDFLSLTVIGPNVYEADRYATAAFAMGERGMYLIEKLRGFEGYAITKDGHAAFTSGFEQFT